MLYNVVLVSAIQHDESAISIHERGFSDGASGEEPICQCRRCKKCGLNPWVRKITWSSKWEPTPVFLLGKSHGLVDHQSTRVAELDMAERAHTHFYILVHFTFAELCEVGLNVRRIKFVLYGQFFMQKPIEFMPPDRKYFQESNFLLISRM